MTDLTLSVMIHLRKYNLVGFELVKKLVPASQEFFCKCGKMISTIQTDKCIDCIIDEYHEDTNHFQTAYSTHKKNY